MANTKKSTTKKVEPKVATKTAAKKTTTKKVASKTPAKKTTTKKVVKEVAEVKEVAVKETPVVKNETKKVEEKNFLQENVTNILIAVLCLLLAGNLILLIVGHNAKLKDGKEVIASIKGNDYTADDLFTLLKEKYGSEVLVNQIDAFIVDKELTDDEKAAAKKEAQEYIESIKNQYESQGYEWETVLSQYGYKNEEALLNEYLVSVKSQKVIFNKIKSKFTDDEINKYYENNVYGNYTVKHILVTPETSAEMSEDDIAAAEENAKNKAQEVIDKYANSEASWANLVAEYSQDEGSKENEGLVENFTKGDMDESFFEAVTKLKENEYTKEPVKSNYGYHVILLVSKTEKPSLKDKKEEMLEEMANEKVNSDANLYLNTLVEIRKDYKLDIKDSTIKSAYEKSING